MRQAVLSVVCRWLLPPQQGRAPRAEACRGFVVLHFIQCSHVRKKNCQYSFHNAHVSSVSITPNCILVICNDILLLELLFLVV